MYDTEWFSQLLLQLFCCFLSVEVEQQGVFTASITAVLLVAILVVVVVLVLAYVGLKWVHTLYLSFHHIFLPYLHLLCTVDTFLILLCTFSDLHVQCIVADIVLFYVKRLTLCKLFTYQTNIDWSQIDTLLPVYTWRACCKVSVCDRSPGTTLCILINCHKSLTCIYWSRLVTLRGSIIVT